MAPLIIDGKTVSAAVEVETAARVAALRARGVVPGLAVVLAGDDPASQSYVNMKDRDCERLGIRSFDARLPADISQERLLDVIDGFNADPHVHGILVQQPFPRQLDVEEVVARVSPDKDVDGFHPVNLGRLMRGLPGHRACTPWGVMRMLDHYGIELAGTADLPAVCREADILVAAIGRPKMIGPEYVGEGAVVIDVGINRTDAGMVGDVDFDAVAPMCSAITPVPGGVGPMTRAILMSNTAAAAEKLTA
jgi:methylenetetrahydrofolate dehydrogenase (NADP+)/methenyltetrahydrofolate cyclohydrolase